MFQKAKNIVLKAMFPIFSISSKSRGPIVKINLKGTGFFIDGNGLLISASHVFEKDNKELIYLYKGIPSINGIDDHLKIEEVFRNQRLDLFIGTIQMKTSSFLELRKDLIDIGSHVCLGGYPNLNYVESWKETSISSIGELKETDKNFLSYVTEALPLPRMSGGPAFTPEGKVIGMISGSMNSKNGILLNSKTILETKEQNL